MITDKAYKAVTITKKTVQAIEKALKSSNITHEPINYDVFLFNATGYTILTNHCTIEITTDQITVNEKPVDNIDDMIYEVLAVEQV
jgi:hypothetical protein